MQYRSFVDLPGADTNAVLLALGQKIGAEGFLGLTANKDLGLISAYQEDNGKKSPINGTVSQLSEGVVRAEVTFSLAKGLASPSAAIRDYLCQVLEATTPADQRVKPGEETFTIRLRTPQGDVGLPTTVGSFRQSGFGPAIVMFFDFSGARAEARVTERRPVLIVRAEANPTNAYVFVKCETGDEEDRRSVKVGSAGKLLRAGVTGKMDIAPDEDWTIPVTVTADQVGIWRVSPSKDLVAGEYGLWDLAGGGAALFGSD